MDGAASNRDAPLVGPGQDQAGRAGSSIPGGVHQADELKLAQALVAKGGKRIT